MSPTDGERVVLDATLMVTPAADAGLAIQLAPVVRNRPRMTRSSSIQLEDAEPIRGHTPGRAGRGPVIQREGDLYSRIEVALIGRGERSQADVIDHLRGFVVGAEDYLNHWATRGRSG